MDHISDFFSLLVNFTYLMVWIFAFVYAIAEGWAYLIKVTFGLDKKIKKNQNNYDSFQD